MNWIQVLTIIGANFGLSLTMFLWIRKEANADRKELAASIASSAASWRSEAKEFRDEMKNFREMWANESKDFHARLCLAEERSKSA